MLRFDGLTLILAVTLIALLMALFYLSIYPLSSDPVSDDDPDIGMGETPRAPMDGETFAHSNSSRK